MKSEHAYRTITEVAELLQVQPSVLRFWETQFSQIKPTKRMGRRYYQSDDIVLLAKIRDYLYKDLLTIKGVQKILKESSADYRSNIIVNNSGDQLQGTTQKEMAVNTLVQEMKDIKEDLAQYL